MRCIFFIKVQLWPTQSWIIPFFSNEIDSIEWMCQEIKAIKNELCFTSWVVFGPQTFLSIRVTVHVLRENLILILNITRNNKIEIQVDRHCKFRCFSYIKEILAHTLYNMIYEGPIRNTIRIRYDTDMPIREIFLKFPIR
jgi:hypothetical protein